MKIDQVISPKTLVSKQQYQI